MSDTLRRAFERQSETCTALGSPFMGRLMSLFARRLGPGGRVAGRLLSWPGRVDSAGQSVPLRIAGALHALVLDGADRGLSAAYPPNTVPDDVLWSAVLAAFQRHEARLLAWLDRAPQTNEVRRANALMCAAAGLRARTGLPLVVSELGAAAGLNLHFDRFQLALPAQSLGDRASAVRLTPDWTGPLPPSAPIDVVDRAGVDLSPIDARQDPRRLLAYLWPDQPDRLARTKAAIALAETGVETGDAAHWLARRLGTRRPGALHLVYHTIAWQYFPPSTQRAALDALEMAGTQATPDAPLARLSMEADGNTPGAALDLWIWDGHRSNGAKLPVGRIDFHGRWVNIYDAAWDALC